MKITKQRKTPHLQMIDQIVASNQIASKPISSCYLLPIVVPLTLPNNVAFWDIPQGSHHFLWMLGLLHRLPSKSNSTFFLPFELEWVLSGEGTTLFMKTI